MDPPTSHGTSFNPHSFDEATWRWSFNWSSLISLADLSSSCVVFLCSYLYFASVGYLKNCHTGGHALNMS